MAPLTRRSGTRNRVLEPSLTVPGSTAGRHKFGLSDTWNELSRNRLIRVASRRLVLAVPLLIMVSGLSFVLVSLTPGDAADQILGTTATPQEYAALRRALGLDLPLYDQYWQWFRHAITGNLGTSIFTGQSVTQAVSQRIPVTLSLLLGALLVSVVVGVSLGVFSALRGGALGHTVDGLALIGFALPAFWVGAELIVLFAVRLSWLPATGYVFISQSPVGWLKSLVLPVIALSLYGVAATAKQTREAMLDVLGSEYIRMARANGVTSRSIVFCHALKNASLRVVTVLGVVAVGLLGGTVLVENVFALPGLGSLVVTAATEHDLPVVQGVAIYFTVMVVVINLLIDLAYTWLNPRVRIQ
jgi:peptide/nickel transport system permease protein